MALKVLIVDDEALARSRLRTLLGDCADPRSEVVGEAGNAVQAMEQIQRTPCDLVLLDIHMPGVDGMALAANLRDLMSPPQVIFVTAHAEHAVHDAWLGPRVPKRIETWPDARLMIADGMKKGEILRGPPAMYCSCSRSMVPKPPMPDAM